MAIKVAGVEVVSDSRDLTIDGGTVKLNGHIALQLVQLH
jgi:hypothetical protein